MKELTPQKISLVILLVFTGIIIFYISGFAPSSSNNSGRGIVIPDLRLRSLSGATEFRFIPQNDTRTWHIVNKYLPENSGQDYNISTYEFTSDSVSVINEYSGFPADSQLDMALANFQQLTSNY